MTKLIIPAAGESSRYDLGRPKFLLNTPTDGLMLEKSIAGIMNGNKTIDEIIILGQSKHFENISEKKIATKIEDDFQTKVNFILLPLATKSMVDTISVALQTLDKDVSIIIKDCDNFVLPPIDFFNYDGNSLCYVDLVDYPNIQASNKSFLQLNEKGFVSQIIEKKIVSSQINVGCVKFKSASDFIFGMKYLGNLTGEIFLSDVIRALLDNSIDFMGFEANEYIDWGTETEWFQYQNMYKTLFVDLDGVLIRNENPFGKNSDWNSVSPIEKNLDFLLSLSKSNFCKFIFVTSRWASKRELIESKLKSFGFVDFELIMELPHCRRYIINDFAPTNPFPSAIAINLERNAENLEFFI